MTNPRQIGFFDQVHPIQADIGIKENHEPLRLSEARRKLGWEAFVPLG